jgi:hypothetical protein
MTRTYATTRASGVEGSSYTPASVDEHTDVDTVSDPPARDEVLKWNGTQWVPAVYNATFAMTIQFFDSNQTALQLMGPASTLWVAAGNLTFTMSYVNPPPSSGWINVGGGGITWPSRLDLTNPYTNASSVYDTNYPTSKGSTLTMTLYAWDGGTQRTATDTVLFMNWLKYGPTTVADSWNNLQVTGLASTLLMPASTSHVGTFATTCGASQYILFAYPASYSTIPKNGFQYNSVTCPFTDPTVTLNVTNSAGFSEVYRIYRSSGTNLGNSNLVTSVASYPANTINHIYWGRSPVSSSYTELVITGMTSQGPWNRLVSNTKGRLITMTGAAGEYLIYALPVRLGTVTFKVGGFAGGFESPETLSNLTNINGYKESYYVYRSTNSGFGETYVEIT